MGGLALKSLVRDFSVEADELMDWLVRILMSQLLCIIAHVAMIMIVRNEGVLMP